LAVKSNFNFKTLAFGFASEMYRYWICVSALALVMWRIADYVPAMLEFCLNGSAAFFVLIEATWACFDFVKNGYQLNHQDYLLKGAAIFVGYSFIHSFY
jgi:hypothetical protein